MNVRVKNACAAVAWMGLALLLSGCASTCQFIPTGSTTPDLQQYRLYVARHKAMPGCAVWVSVRCNGQRVGVVGYNGYLTWLCDRSERNTLTWGIPGRKAVLSNVTNDEVVIDIFPSLDWWKHRQLDAEEGRALVSSMSPPSVVGRGYSMVNDSSVGAQKGYVEFYEPDDDTLWSRFNASRIGAEKSNLKRTEVNAWRGGDGKSSDILYVPQRLRFAAPLGQQTYVLTAGSWSNNVTVDVTEGHVTPVRVDIVPEAEGVKSVGTVYSYRIITFKVDVACEAPVELTAHDKQLLCK